MSIRDNRLENSLINVHYSCFVPYFKNELTVKFRKEVSKEKSLILRSGYSMNPIT